MKRTSTLLAAAAATIILAFGCSQDGGGSAPSAPAPAPEAPAPEAPAPEAPAPDRTLNEADLSAVNLPEDPNEDRGEAYGVNLSSTYYVTSRLSPREGHRKPTTRHHSCFSNSKCKGKNLSGLNLSRLDLRGVNFENANMNGVVMHLSDLRGVNLEDAELFDADLRLSWLDDADLYDTDLRQADLRGAYLTKSDLRYARMQDANLGYFYLRGRKYRTYLYKARLYKTRLNGTNLEGANLSSADNLRRAYFDKHTDFSDALMIQVDLQRSRWVDPFQGITEERSGKWTGVDLRLAKLSGYKVPFRKEYKRNRLYVLNLTDADLSHTVMKYATFSGGIYTDADMTGAVLEGSRIKDNKGRNRETHFVGVDLDKTDLRGVSFWDVRGYSGAYLVGAKNCDKAIVSIRGGLNCPSR